MNINLNSSGDFNIQDNGTPHFTMFDNGISYFGDDTYWRQGSTASGDFFARIYDSSDDGIIDIYENNAYNIRLHGNGTTIFNAQNISTNDFRIESASDTYQFFSDASLNRIGIGESAPKTKLHIEEAAGQTLMLARADGTIVANEQLGGIGFDRFPTVTFLMTFVKQVLLSSHLLPRPGVPETKVPV